MTSQSLYKKYLYSQKRRSQTMKTKFLIVVLATASSLFAQSHTSFVTIPIEYSVAKYKEVQVSQPRQVCEDVRVAVRVPNARDTNSLGVDTLIGATAGVIIGNQIGKGSGRDAAKVVGGILGATTANRMREPSYTTRYETQTQCKTIYDTHTQTQLSGYDNYFFIDGVEHIKHSSSALESVRVRITYSY